MKPNYATSVIAAPTSPDQARARPALPPGAGRTHNRRETSMSPSILNAGRTTHLKIVAVAFVAGIAVVVVGINARTSNLATARVGTDGVVVKAGQPTAYAVRETFAVR